MDLESPVEVGGDNGEVYFFFFFGLSVERVKHEHILGYRFPRTPEGEHQRQDPQGRKSMGRPRAASYTHSFPSEAISGTDGETEAADTCAAESLSQSGAEPRTAIAQSPTPSILSPSHEVSAWKCWRPHSEHKTPPVFSPKD